MEEGGSAFYKIFDAFVFPSAQTFGVHYTLRGMPVWDAC
jgi:hypothetical protein